MPLIPTASATNVPNDRWILHENILALFLFFPVTAMMLLGGKTMPRPLSVITLEIVIPLSTDNLKDTQLDRFQSRVTKVVKDELRQFRIPYRTVKNRMIIDDVSIKESNALVMED